MILSKKTLKGLIYMPQANYIKNLLKIKDENIYFYENILTEGYRKHKKCNIINAYLSYIPKYCINCGCIFESNNDYEKKGFDKGSYIVYPSIIKYDTYIFLKKQRIKCLHCNSSFSCSTSLVNKGSFISNKTKHSIAHDLMKKRSEKDIAIDNNVSSNTVERIIDSYYDSSKFYKNYLPSHLSFDEFKSVKAADGAMSFHICNAKNGKIIDIVEDRRLFKLLRYFSRYSHKARANVKTITIDMYSPYISLIKQMFPNADIIIDKFHLTQLISRSLNKTRIMVMKKDKTNYNKLKRYWKLILKPQDELDYSKWKRWTCFDHLLTESDLVYYLINVNTTLKSTYFIYQKLLKSFKNNDLKLLTNTLYSNYLDISEYMKTSIKTLKEFIPYIKNTFKYKYHNGYIEGNNNFIKVLKRIAFGFKSFLRMKARIMICKGLIYPKRKEA